MGYKRRTLKVHAPANGRAFYESVLVVAALSFAPFERFFSGISTVKHLRVLRNIALRRAPYSSGWLYRMLCPVEGMGTRMTRIARIFADFAERGVDRDSRGFFSKGSFI